MVCKNLTELYSNQELKLMRNNLKKEFHGFIDAFQNRLMVLILLGTGSLVLHESNGTKIDLVNSVN
jgi:hypothetical protein